MAEPTLPLQAAVITALRSANTALGSRVYDSVPPDAAFPYACLTGWDAAQADADCISGDDVFFDVQIYTQATTPGRVQSAQIAGQVAAALHGATFAVDGFGQVEVERLRATYFTDSDGVRRRAVVSFKALLDS